MISGTEHGGRGPRVPASPLMEEFRARRRKFSLSEITDHVLEFALDQHGSRFIQQELESAAEEDKQAVQNEFFCASLFVVGLVSTPQTRS